MVADGDEGLEVIAKVLIVVGALVVGALILVMVIAKSVQRQQENEAKDAAVASALYEYDEAIECLVIELAELRPEADHRGIVRSMKDCTDESFHFTNEGQTQPRLKMGYGFSAVTSTSIGDDEVAFVVGTVGYGEPHLARTSLNSARALMCWTITIDVADRVIVRADDADCDPEVAEWYQSAKRTKVPDTRKVG